MTEEFSKIESLTFDVQVSVESGLSSIARKIFRQPVVKKLYQELKQRGTSISLLARLAGLTRKKVDARYRNPYDAAIATYLLLIVVLYPDQISTAARLTRNAQNLWIASHVANALLHHGGAGQFVVSQVPTYFGENPGIVPAAKENRTVIFDKPANYNEIFAGNSSPVSSDSTVVSEQRYGDQRLPRNETSTVFTQIRKSLHEENTRGLGTEEFSL
jgi:hypothetical protein